MTKTNKIILIPSLFLFLAMQSYLLAADTLPEKYEVLSGCQKQELLWKKIESSKHEKLPKYKKMGLGTILKMAVQKMTTKVKTVSDISPNGWTKHLHQKGAVAKAKFVSTGDHKYSGIFQGAECTLLRLSLTFKPTKKRGVAPGLAFKVLRDGIPSVNVSALYTLSGQEQEFNFFKNSLSNIVPIGSSMGQKIVHNIFERVTDYPEQLGVSDMAKMSSKGVKVTSPNSPRQLFFVPNPELTRKFLSEKHEIRDDFLEIAAGTAIYKVYAVSAAKKDFNYYDYEEKHMKEFLKDSQHIGEIKLTSKFIASEFGDTKIFFKHQTKE